MAETTIAGLRQWVVRAFVGRRASPYVLAVLLLGTALALASATSGAIALRASLLLLWLAVAGASYFGGLGPGLLATALGLVAGAGLGAERGFSGPIGAFLFAVSSLLVVSFGEWSLRQRQRNVAAARVLAQREEQLRSIFDTAPEAMIIINELGNIVSYGASAERMFGWRQAEALGQNISMLMPQPYRDQHDSYLRRYLETGERRIIGIGRVVVGQRKDGTTFPMTLAVAEANSAQGRLFTGFVSDLTEQQEREARVQELQAELVHLSRSSAMGEMASALAHELNQPLSAIANYLGGVKRLLERDAASDVRIVGAVEKASEQALRAGDIIRRLRDFLTRGESEREMESLGKLVHEACALALVGAQEDGLTVSFEFGAQRDQVFVDRVQIQQVIVNLVRNARDAMLGAPRRELRISTKLEEGIGVVSVADTGSGLDPDIAARLFEPFITTKAQGMGVGLSISRTIVEAHGGRIWTEPNPSGGAIFSFSVPCAGIENELSAR